MVFKIVPICPYSLYLQTIPVGGPQTPTCGRESPATPSTDAELGRIAARRRAAHRIMPSCLTQQFSVKKKCLEIQISV